MVSPGATPQLLQKEPDEQAATAFFDPIAADRLYREGAKTKEDVSKYVIANTFIKVKDYWSQSYEIQNFVRPSAMLGQAPWRSTGRPTQSP